MRPQPLLPVFLYLPPTQLLIPSTMWGDCTPQLSILPSLQVEMMGGSNGGSSPDKSDDPCRKEATSTLSLRGSPKSKSLLPDPVSALQQIWFGG